MPRGYYSKDRRDEGERMLRSLLSPGDTVYLILRYTSVSGNSCAFSVITWHRGKPHRLDMAVAAVLGLHRKTFDTGFTGETMRKSMPPNDAKTDVTKQLSTFLFGRSDALHTEWM